MSANLDAAHWIRNKGSAQFKAAVALESARRWCLTGTPIQNSLNDLVSLLSFLHLEPFSSSAIFQRHILEPLARNPQTGASNLRELLRTICLRRDERLLKLPEPSFEQVEVQLREEERALYNGVMAQCARDIDDVVSSRAKGNSKKYNILFTAMTRLRRLCNNGAFGFSTESNPSSEAEQGCEFCSGTDKDRPELVMQSDICSECGRQLRSRTNSRRSTPKRTRPVTPAPRLSFPSPGMGPSVNQTLETGISSKIQAVMDRLDQVENGSKRQVQSPVM